MAEAEPNPLDNEQRQQRMRSEMEVERGRGLVVGGEDLIEALQLAEIGENGDISELTETVQEALSFREGLIMGAKGPAYEFNPSGGNDTERIAYLQKLFTTTENAIKRPDLAINYLDPAIDDAIQGRIRRAQMWHENPAKFDKQFIRKRLRYYRVVNEEREITGRQKLREDEVQARVEADLSEKRRIFENEFKATAALVELGNHVNDRRIGDTAFVERMRTCEDPGAAANLYQTKNTPDSFHWIGIFHGHENGQFGNEVNKVFEEIVKFGLQDDVVRRLGMRPIPRDIRKQVPISVYANGFDTATAFGTWLNQLISIADGRMDVVWNAWKFALTTEVVDTLGEFRKRKESGEENYMLASPPLGNALMTFLNHWKEKGAIELGLDANEKQVKLEKFVGHGGLPIIWGMIPDLCSDYLHEAKLKFDSFGLGEILSAEDLERLYKNLPKRGDSDYDPKYDKLRQDIYDAYNDEKGKKTVDLSLWDLWLYGRISFADPKFPWYNTQTRDSEAAPGELPIGTFGGWLLTRFRAGGEKNVLSDLRSRPALNELGDPEFFSNRLRNWTKVFGPVKDDMQPWENPRAVWLGSILYLHKSGTALIEPDIVKKQPWRKYRIVDPKHDIKQEAAGQSDRAIGVGDIFQRAIDCGWIREEDREWIKDYFGIIETLVP